MAFLDALHVEAHGRDGAIAKYQHQAWGLARGRGRGRGGGGAHGCAQQAKRTLSKQGRRLALQEQQWTYSTVNSPP